jgi:hypothetical protein
MHPRVPAVRLSALVAALLCSGCMSLPQPSEQWLTARHAGTVVDARSGAPIQGVQVRMARFPEQRATTDAAGRFALSPVIDSRGRTRNFFGGVDAAACVDRIEVEREGYSPVTLDKGDDKAFKAACQNAVFEYRIHLNPVK